MSMTPTSHGAWRVIDGQLVDESAKPVPKPRAMPTPPAASKPVSTTPRQKAPIKPE